MMHIEKILDVSWKTYCIVSFVHFAAPPSYAECMMDKVDIYQRDEGDETDGGDGGGRVHGDTMWAPSYTYYNFNYNTQYGMQAADQAFGHK